MVKDAEYGENSNNKEHPIDDVEEHANIATHVETNNPHRHHHRQQTAAASSSFRDVKVKEERDARLPLVRDPKSTVVAVVVACAVSLSLFEKTYFLLTYHSRREGE